MDRSDAIMTNSSLCNSDVHTFSIVIPVYKNESNIEETIDYITSRLNLFSKYNIEIILVDDGSPDNSWQEMKKAYQRFPHLIKIARLARNFGQGTAIQCGMNLAQGDAIGVISCDLQDPFELFVKILEEWEKGYKLVIAERKDREEHGIMTMFSRIMHRLVKHNINADYPIGGFDFFLVDRELAKLYCEHYGASGGMQLTLLWFGFDHISIPYTRKARKKGKSAWSVSRRVTAAIKWITFFSNYLLRKMLACAGVMCFAAVILLIAGCLRTDIAMVGIGMLLLCSGLLMSALYVIGEYLERVLEATRGFPKYILAEVHGYEREGKDDVS